MCSPGVRPIPRCQAWFPSESCFRGSPLTNCLKHLPERDSLVAQSVKRLLARQETQVRSPCWEDPLEEGTATHSSILAWRIRQRSLADYNPLGHTESDTTEATYHAHACTHLKAPCKAKKTISRKELIIKGGKEGASTQVTSRQLARSWGSGPVPPPTYGLSGKPGHVCVEGCPWQGSPGTGP